MGKEKLAQMQDIIYGILCEIDRFCKDNQIRYFLSGGTCLGAVRHHGFIPWDDDGDIMMPRKDYERFCQLFNGGCDDRFRLSSLDNDSDWNVPYARVWYKKSRIRHRTVYDPDIGVYVDVFPLDGVPENKALRKLLYLRLKILDTACSEAKRKKYPEKCHRIIRKSISLMTRPLGARFFAKRMDKTARRRPFETSAYIACTLPVHYGEKETIAREKMESAVAMPFRDSLFDVPAGYDTYLKNLYGENYMKIPDEEDRVNHLENWDLEIYE